MSDTDGASSPTFATLLRRARQAAGFSQVELAERAGMSGQTIGALERGVRQQPYPATLRHLADALGLAGDARTAFLENVPPRQPGGRHTPSAASATESHPPESRPPAPGSSAGPDALSPVSPPSAPDALGLSALADLPIPLTPLLGRDDAAAQVCALLHNGVRLLTLTGPGGVGKTRLSIHIAGQMRASSSDGVAFVPLAALTLAELVVPTVAQALGLRAPESGKALRESLHRALRERQLLLVLDNCEHVSDGAVEITTLLHTCARLVILATSREPLHVDGEQVYPLTPLALPNFERKVTVEEAERSPAVSLFVARAQAASPTFALTAANASAVAAICGRLDGLPLALELAAPHIKILPPGALLARLHQILPLLTGGRRDLPTRQQALQSAIAWSYSALDEGERRLFRRLAVFSGGGTLEAVEAVCQGRYAMDAAESDAPDVLVGMGSLVDKSLLRAEAGPEDASRFGMLQTIREYATAQLEASWEAEEARRRHATYYLSMAEEAAPRLTGPEQAIWLDRVARDLDNLRAALVWARAQGQTEVGLRLAGALVRFSRVRGYGSEGLEWLTPFIAHMDPLALKRAVAGTTLGWLTGFIARQVELNEGTGRHLSERQATRLHLAADAADRADAQKMREQAVAWLGRAATLYRAAGENVGALHAVNALAGVTYDAGDLPAALAHYQDAVALARAAEDPGELARALGNVGEMYYHLNALDRAAEYQREALAIARQSGRVEIEASELSALGNVARRQGNLQQATAIHRQALELKVALGYRRQIAMTLEDLAALAVVEGRMERAARLCGAAMGLREAIGSPLPAPERLAAEQVMAEARTALGEEGWAAALAAGRALLLDEAIAFAMQTHAYSPR